MKSIATIILLLSTTLVLGDVVFPDGSKGAQAPGGPVGPNPPVGFARPSLGAHPELSSVSHDPAKEGAVPTELSDDPAHPQARFFGLFGGKNGGLFGGGGGGGLFGGGIGGLFCKSCSFEDPIKADRCCKRGEVECCSYSQLGGFGGGFGGAVPPVPFGGGGIDKFGKGGPPGYVPGGVGFGGSGFGGSGFGGAGFGGAGFGGGFGGFGGLKPGYCPRATLFSGIGNLFKLRDGEVPLDEEHNPIALDDHHQKGNFNEVKRRALRQVKFEDSKDQPAQDEHITNSDEPTQRFLPVLSGLPNPFCRDQCFNDFDCPSALKCCINFGNCRECSYPRFNNFF